MAIDIKPLKVLDIIMSTGSVTDAAHILRRAQPQISRTLRTLEEDLGFELFQREGRRLIPTSRGRAFHAQARGLIDKAEALSQLAETMRRSQDVYIRIAAPAYAAHLLVPKTIASMSIIHPEINFELITMHRQADVKWDEDLHFDAAVVAMPFQHAGLAALPLAHVEFVALLPEGHPLTQKNLLTAQDFVDQPFVSVNWETQMRRFLDPFFESMGKDLRTRVTTNTTGTACELIASGVGVGLGDPLVARAYVGRGLVMRRFEPRISYALGVVSASGTAPSQAIREFIRLTLETAQDLCPGLVRAI